MLELTRLPNGDMKLKEYADCGASYLICGCIVILNCHELENGDLFLTSKNYNPKYSYYDNILLKRINEDIYESDDKKFLYSKL